MTLSCTIENEEAVTFQPLHMERWQSTYEHRVRFNLSDSGVLP